MSRDLHPEVNYGLDRTTVDVYFEVNKNEKQIISKSHHNTNESKFIGIPNELSTHRERNVEYDRV
jgi:hypothetical protein